MKDEDAGTYWRGPKVVVVEEGRYVSPDDPTWNGDEYEERLRLGACTPLPPNHPRAKQYK